MRRRGFDAVSEVEPGDVVEWQGLRVVTVRAEHHGFGPPVGGTDLAVGFVVTGSQRVYFAGDTDLFESMDEIGRVDVGLIPIWGWGPTLGRGGHLDPKRAAEAVRRIAPQVAIPIHWGTYFPLHLGLRRLPAYLDRPPVEFVVEVAEVAPKTVVRVLQPGERADL